MFRKKYKILYMAIDKDNEIPFDIKLKAFSLEKAKNKFEKLAVKNEKKNKVKYKILKIVEADEK